VLDLPIEPHRSRGAVGPGALGYRPVHVTVTSRKPTTANHLITVRFYEGLSDVVSVEQDIAMPMGSTQAEAAIACPQFRSQLNYWWDVWVDGVKEPALSLESNARLQVFSPFSSGIDSKAFPMGAPPTC